MPESHNNTDQFLASLLRVQQILAGERALTQAVFGEVARLDFAQLARKRFTVAVVGQMRSGKSTLINALVGKDIAPTAVNECTATINHFIYSDKPELHEQFRVRWFDESEDYYPLSEIEAWIGKGLSEQNLLQKLASNIAGKRRTLKETRYLDFFADTPFLKTANIVDTPGLRSTIEMHEKGIISYLSQSEVESYGDKQAEATRREGASADAVVYVLNPVARQNDADILDLFGEKTRLPGSNAYNSVAVVHMWENDWDMEVDPVDYLTSKIRRIEEQLKGKVSCVMAASGLLSRCLDWLDEEHWRFFTQCAEMSRNEVKRLTNASVFGSRAGSDDKFPLESRQALVESIKRRLMEAGRMSDDNAQSTTTAIIRFLCRFACVRQLRSTGELKAQVRELGGLQRLEALLEKQFFARASLIKNSTILTRIWEPCQIALEQLRIYEQDRNDDIGRGHDVLKLLEGKNGSDPSLASAVSYVKSTFNAVSSEACRVRSARKELYEISRRLDNQFRSFEEDIEALEAIDSLRDATFSPEEIGQLRALFGAKGLSLEERLLSTPVKREDVQRRYAFWAQKQQLAYGDERKIATLARKHLEDILDQFS